MRSSNLMRAYKLSTLTKYRRYTTVRDRQPFRLAIIGSGPAGFYTAYRVMSRMQDAFIDMYEQLPVPFGLVRFGVAPDHPEVKNCQDRFTGVATSSRFNFIGNVNVGKDIPLLKIRDQYDAVLFAHGASKDRELGIPGEHLRGVYTARAFVGWYNGLPEYASLSPNLESGDTAVIIGQGNVALDIARILLSGIDRLRTTDITSGALDVLSRSRIKKVHVVGRRGPLQASFTIKEVRELIQLPEILFKPIQSNLLPGPEVKLPRAAKRMTDLLRKQSSASIGSNTVVGSKMASLDFLLSPIQFNEHSQKDQTLTSVTLAQNIYQEQGKRFEQAAKVSSTNERHNLNTSLVFRSIGYKSEPLPGMEELGINFDMQTGTLPNIAGRVVNGNSQLPGLYCAGWVKRGPTGVIASTMEDAFSTAEVIVADWESKASGKPGWDALRASIPRATDWQDWLEIDAAEKRIGLAIGKKREKFDSIDQMLATVHKM